MKMIAELGEVLTVRTVQMRSDDGVEFWQGRFVLELSDGARWHGATTQLHRSREEAERAALALMRSKGWAPGASAPLTTQCGAKTA